MRLSVRYMDVPEGAQDEAAAYATQGQPFGTAEHLLTGASDIPWATLEPGSWTLDGSRKMLPDKPENIGWWSQVRSAADGRFPEPPAIRVSFSRPYTATGITFWFGQSLGHWCREIYVAWYRGETRLAEVTAFPDSAQWVLEQIVEGFDRIEIRLLATNVPGQFAKIQQLQIGQIAVFGEDELVGVHLLNEVDPSLCELPVDTMAVEIRDRKDRKLLPQRNQVMQLYWDGKLMASHYITDSSREGQHDYRFRCQSIIGRLEDVWLGGVVLDTVAMNLAELLKGVPYYLDPGLAEMEITGYLPVCTRREALQQIAFAIGAVVTTRGDGTICLKPLETEVCGAFDDDSIFTGAKVTRGVQIAEVRLTAHDYMPGGERETLLNGVPVSGTDVLFLFSRPHHGYEISGGILTAWGENWVRITAHREVTLTAQHFIHTTSVYTKTNPLATAAEEGNVVIVEDATLVHSGNAEQVLNRLYAYHRMRDLLKQEIIVSGQQAGQLVRSANPWDTATEGYIISMESEFTGTGQTAGVTIRGREVPRV